MELIKIDSLVERFSIMGLHGYKDITLDFAGSATVVVAENGSGKTTLLNALNAFLNRRFHRLAALNFRSLECKFKDQPFPLTLERQHLVGEHRNNVNSMIAQLSAEARISETELLDFVQEYKPEKFSAQRDQAIIRQGRLEKPLISAKLAP